MTVSLETRRVRMYHKKTVVDRYPTLPAQVDGGPQPGPFVSPPHNLSMQANVAAWKGAVAGFEATASASVMTHHWGGLPNDYKLGRNPWPRIEFRWPGDDTTRRGRAGREPEHAYFWFTDNGLTTQVTGTGEGYSDSTTIHLFRGAENDYSQLGMKPTKRALSKITPNTLWVYAKESRGASSGDVAIGLTNPAERMFWDAALSSAQKFREQMLSLAEGDQTPEELYEKVETRLTPMLQDLVGALAALIEDFDQLNLVSSYRKAQRMAKFLAGFQGVP